MKRALIALSVVLLLPVLALGAVMVATFSGRKALVDAAELPGAARTVMDGYVAMFVLPAGDKAVALIDCGSDPDGAAILAELKRRGLGLDAVKAIFLTHGHPDHTAGCHLFPSAAVMAMGAEVAVAAGKARTRGPLPSRMDMPAEKRIAVTRELQDGEVVNVGTLAVKAYAVAGHTAGSASYFANGTLFMGDNATAASDGKVMGPPWIFSDDLAQANASIEALGARLRAESAEVKAIAFAHSGPVEGLGPLLAFHAKP